MQINARVKALKIAKKHGLLIVSIALLVVVLNFSTTGATNSISFSSHERGVVDKATDDNFTVKISFKNTGHAEGEWSVNVVFEGDSWSWKGTPQSLALSAGAEETLKWTGTVPAGAALGSVARLVVYYDDAFKALDWWIHVVQGAELSIRSSSVH
jgi:hypothetical protein